MRPVLFKRRHPGSALSTAFLVDQELDLIGREASARRGGPEDLRAVALAELGNASAETRATALLCLAVAGGPEDLTAAESLARDPSNVVRKAFEVARFKLRRR